MQQADIVIQGNCIFTGVGNAPQKGAIAIKGGKIVDVGSDDHIEAYIGNGTERFRFDDQLIMPGFHDVHVHVFLGSLFEDSVKLANARSAKEVAQMVKSFADSRPDDEWIFGFEWYHVYWDEKVMPHRHVLDELIPDRPVFLWNGELHGAWLNSKALELSGIDETTPDPPFGSIIKDEAGIPTGVLLETAMQLAIKAANIPTSRGKHLMKRFLSKANRLGITSVSDMLPLTGFELGDPYLYKVLEGDDELTVRHFFLSTLDGNLERARQFRNEFQSDVLKFSGLKQFLDGVPTTYTAYMIEPYTDDPSTRGEPFLPPETIKQWVTEADREGFRVRLHACGDGAVRLGLDAYALAQRQNGKRDSRHTIEHIEVIHPDDIQRFAELGVITSMQPEHLAMSHAFTENIYPSRLGKERTTYSWPIKTLVDSGARMAFGSDFPVVELNPLLEIYRAITRLHNDGEPQGGWNPQEKISVAAALKHYTSGSAYANFMEHKLGTIEAGKLADIVVLDRNLFAVEAEQILETRVKLTVMSGSVVYEG